VEVLRVIHLNKLKNILIYYLCLLKVYCQISTLKINQKKLSWFYSPCLIYTALGLLPRTYHLMTTMEQFLLECPNKRSIWEWSALNGHSSNKCSIVGIKWYVRLNWVSAVCSVADPNDFSPDPDDFWPDPDDFWPDPVLTFENVRIRFRIRILS
jgi:hypothetical protein